MHEGHTHFGHNDLLQGSITSFEEYFPITKLIDHDIYSIIKTILPDKFSTEDIEKLEQGYVWTYEEDGNIVYTIDFEYLEGSIKKVLVATDSEYTIKSINIIEVFIGSLNNSVSVHNVVVDSLAIYTVDGEKSNKGKGGRNSTSDCKMIVFGTTNNGSGTFDPGNNGTTTGGTVGGTDKTGGGVKYPFKITCGCDPGHLGGKSNVQCNCTLPDIIIIREGDNTLKGNDKESGSRNDQEYWDCIEDLIGCQMLNDYDLAIQTLKHCNGVYDVNDQGPKAGNDGTNQFIGPEFCDEWKDYQTECLGGNTSTSDVYQPWAGFMIDYPDLFFDAIEGLPECTSTDEMEDIILFTTNLSKDKGENAIDLMQVFEDCFGIPNQNGEYIDCSNSENSSFEMTLYADQPTPNSRDPYSGIPGVSLDVGHTFLSLVTNFGGSNTTITYGFYPSQAVDLQNPIVDMAINDDGGHEFSSSITIQLTCDQFNQAINNSISATSNNYDLNNYNCTDYGIEIANLASLGVLDTTSPWVFMGKTYGNSSNPGDLGEDIKDIPNGNINSNGGTAPLTNCN